MKLIGAFAGGVVVTLLVAVAVLFFADLEVTSSDGASGEESESVTVPNVLGQSKADAEAEILNADLLPENDYGEAGGLFRDLNPIGQTSVSTQNPDPGVEVEPGSVVNLGLE